MNASNSPPLLECHGISKTFGGEIALAGVDFSLAAGERHGLVGSNGAGKSTLMKILAGALPDYTGQITIDGRPIRLSSPAEAARNGIAMVYQELSGIGALSVAENLFLGRQPVTRYGRVDWKTINSRASVYLAEMEIEIDVRARLDSYPLVIRQMVEIARGLHSGARVLILDEPTSALSPPETRRLFALLEQLRRRNVAVIFISHFIEDVLAICDRVTVLRDGRLIETRQAAQLEKHELIHTMLGRGLEQEEAGYEASVVLPPRNEGAPICQVRSCSLAGSFDDVDLAVSPSECLGLYGYVGAGHQELAHVIAGAKQPDRGQIYLDDRKLPVGRVDRAVKRGMVLVAADRQQTLAHASQIYKNVTLAHLKGCVGEWLTRRREVKAAQPVLADVGCKPADPTLPAGHLSGGNQQKVVFAKWLLGPLRVLVLEEPTRGMDVGAKEEIMKLIGRLREEGTAVILATTEPELVLAHADRILVFRRGRQTAEFADTTLDKSVLMQHA
jgi:ribose transport system ATP-binding protein